MTTTLEAVRSIAARGDDRPAVRDTTHSLTYAELLARAETLAEAVKKWLN